MRTGVGPCARCGIVRETRPDTIMCADCKYTLTPAEYELWKPEHRRAA